MFTKFKSLFLIAAVVAMSACSSGSSADTSQTTISRSNWEAAKPVETMPLQIFQFEVYEPARMSELEKRALVVSGNVIEVGRTDEGGYVVYLSDSSSDSRADYRGAKVAVVIRAKDVEYGRQFLHGRGEWSKYPCNNGKYLGNLQFACVLAVIE